MRSFGVEIGIISQPQNDAIASIAIILQSIFMLILVYLTNQYSKVTKQYAVTTEKMLNETENYVITTEEIFKASIIDRQIHFYEKRLEQLYMPIYNNCKLFEYLPNSFNEFEAMGIDNFIIKIKPYTYLADDPLQSNLEELLYYSACIIWNFCVKRLDNS